MPVEIEAKMKVEDLGAIRTRLQERGALKAGEYLETNTFFDADDRSLLAADKGLRLRRARNIETGEDEFTLTYKGPRQHGPLKSRDEQELRVANAEDAIAFLNKLGFTVLFAFEKKRESWALEGCKVELDELPHLGTFVEVEGPRDDAVMKVRELLGLGSRPIVKASYTALLMTYLQERGQASRVIKFAK
jgi:adenylate cyclase, class 2